jgi:hypothetical protein
MAQKSSSVRYYLATLVAAVAYVGFSFTTPVRNNVLKLTDSQIFNLRLRVIIPVLIIWFLGTYGVAKFKSYSSSIKDSPDGAGFNKIANGLVFLVYGSIVISVLSTIAGRFTETSAVPTRTIITNYANLLVPVIAYMTLLKGGLELTALAKARKHFKKRLTWLLVIAVVFGAVYLWFIAGKLPLQTTTTKTPPYYLPNTTVLATLTLPYLFVWTLAAAAFTSISVYAHQVKGTIYRQALKRLVIALGWIVAFSIGLQVLTVFNYIWAKYSLQGILNLLYAIIGLYSVGYLLLASGARKLNKLEELE